MASKYKNNLYYAGGAYRFMTAPRPISRQKSLPIMYACAGMTINEE